MRVSLSRKMPAAPASRSYASTGPRRALSRRRDSRRNAPHHPANTAALPSRQLPCEP